MTSTPTPPSTGSTNYAVEWTIKKGKVGFQDDGLGGLFPDDGDETDPPVRPNEFRWNSKEAKLSFDDENGGTIPMDGYEIEGFVYGYTETMSDSGEPTEIRTNLKYEVVSMTMTSTHETNNDTWVDGDTYGGVTFDTESPGRKDELETSKAEVEGGYDYFKLFEKGDYSYLPRNSIALSLSDIPLDFEKGFPTEPLLPGMTGEPNEFGGNKAPVYPMDSITAFVRDSRDSVEVTYSIELKVKAKIGSDYKNITLDNGDIKIKQKFIQPTDTSTEPLEAALQLCNFSNPGGHSQQEFSPGYPVNYPYTMVTGYDGVSGEPSTRGDDAGNARLEKGDIWIDGSTRYYWLADDIPTDVEPYTGCGVSINEEGELVDEPSTGGSRYKDSEGVPTSPIPRVAVACPDEKEELCKEFNPRRPFGERFPGGLTVDITTENGKIISAVVNEPGADYADGDIVVVNAGNNDAYLEVFINEKNKWIRDYVPPSIKIEFPPEA